MNKRIRWDIVTDLSLLLIFSFLTILMLGIMLFRGLNIIELAILFISSMIADVSFNNVIEE